jgi:MYXO-CTERM domain-containing protein
VYASYLGGNNNDDYAGGIAIDAAGNAYVTGRSASATNFPTTTGAYEQTKCGGSNVECAYVVKVAAGGASVVWGTFLGSTDGSQGKAIAVDANGSPYVTGGLNVQTTGFPTTAGAFQTMATAGNQVFVAKLSAAGDALVYSTYLASRANLPQDTANGIAVDSGGNAYVVGNADSNTFPTTAGAYRTTVAGQGDVFVAKLNATGSALVYSTFLGGASGDAGQAIAIDAAGNAYVTGDTLSMNFPTTSDAPQPTFPGGMYAAFASRLDPTGAMLVWSTYLGGGSFDQAYAIAVTAQGGIYIAGNTSGGYPTTQGAFQQVFGGNEDVFVTQLVGGHNSDACGRMSDCLSGFCVDGVCCDSICNNQCAACDVAGSVGTCSPVTGAPHGTREACAVSACACDGTNTDKCTNNGNECDIGVCADDHTLHNPDGTTSDCTPYKCNASGACSTACANVDDCIAPNICDPNGKCIPLPEQEKVGGCACRASPNGWTVWWIGIVAFVVLRRRRRS